METKEMTMIRIEVTEPTTPTPRIGDFMLSKDKSKLIVVDKYNEESKTISGVCILTKIYQHGFKAEDFTRCNVEIEKV